VPAIENPTALAPVVFWDLYAEKIVTTAIYPGQGSITGLNYISLGLAGEAGEFCDQVKKVLRDDGNVLTLTRQEKLWSELGDVLWYMGGAARELRVALSECLMAPPPEWVARGLVGMGTPTALSLAAKRLLRGVSLFGQHVDAVIERGGVMNEEDHTILRKHVTAIYYAANLCAQETGRDIRQIGADNVDKLLSRKERGVLSGDGSKR
jgi:hypothetical protein